MISLSKTTDFLFRSAWGKQALGGYDWDKSQVTYLNIWLARIFIDPLCP